MLWKIYGSALLSKSVTYSITIALLHSIFCFVCSFVQQGMPIKCTILDQPFWRNIIILLLAMKPTPGLASAGNDLTHLITGAGAGISTFHLHHIKDALGGKVSRKPIKSTLHPRRHLQTGGNSSDLGASCTTALPLGEPSSSRQTFSTSVPLRTLIFEAYNRSLCTDAPMDGGVTWLALVENRTAELALSTCDLASGVDTELAVFKGYCGALVPVACSGDAARIHL